MIFIKPRSFFFDKIIGNKHPNKSTVDSQKGGSEGDKSPHPTKTGHGQCVDLVCLSRLGPLRTLKTHSMGTTDTAK